MAKNADIFPLRLKTAENLVFECLPVPHPFIAPANARIVNFDKDFVVSFNFRSRNFSELKASRTVPIGFAFIKYQGSHIIRNPPESFLLKVPLSKTSLSKGNQFSKPKCSKKNLTFPISDEVAIVIGTSDFFSKNSNCSAPGDKRKSFCLIAISRYFCSFSSIKFCNSGRWGRLLNKYSNQSLFVLPRNSLNSCSPISRPNSLFATSFQALLCHFSSHKSTPLKSKIIPLYLINLFDCYAFRQISRFTPLLSGNQN